MIKAPTVAAIDHSFGLGTPGIPSTPKGRPAPLPSFPIVFAPCSRRGWWAMYCTCVGCAAVSEWWRARR